MPFATFTPTTHSRTTLIDFQPESILRCLLRNAGQVMPALSKAGWEDKCQRRSKGTTINHRDWACDDNRLTDHERQRSASTSGQTAESSSTLGVASATALAVGSMAWYYHLYGCDVHAMTPAEEGYVSAMLLNVLRFKHTRSSVEHG